MQRSSPVARAAMIASCLLLCLFAVTQPVNAGKVSQSATALANVAKQFDIWNDALQTLNPKTVTAL